MSHSGRGSQAVQLSPSGAPLSARIRPKNPLLTRDDVGKAKSSCYDLPDDHFSFGRPGLNDAEGCREVMMNWVSHTPRQSHQALVQDFSKINKAAIRAKIANSKDLKKYTSEIGEVPIKPTIGCASPRAKPLPSDQQKDFAYGMKVRPSTPIKQLVNHTFGREHEEALGNFYSDVQQFEMQERQVRKIPLTKASRGHASTVKKAALAIDDSKELFKMSKFKRAPCKVEFPGGKGSELRRMEGLAADARMNGDDVLSSVIADTVTGTGDGN